MKNKFRINFPGNMYCFELYNQKGNYVYDLQEAIEIAESEYPDVCWEVWNGKEGYQNKEYNYS
jgi:hypothetical protein